ncbi:hypothetical protein HU200_067129 [Digitaria exilis]|uniref:non-specific serine/threonine protein kinase n=1 Tax=Digitaria exilis TaxID=1010633 RepID=A0A835A5M5_9POAL|nr:hypothetical protein HU200_067129 [Digitaria exilis]
MTLPWTHNGTRACAHGGLGPHGDGEVGRAEKQPTKTTDGEGRKRRPRPPQNLGCIDGRLAAPAPPRATARRDERGARPLSPAVHAALNLRIESPLPPGTRIRRPRELLTVWFGGASPGTGEAHVPVVNPASPTVRCTAHVVPCDHNKEHVHGAPPVHESVPTDLLLHTVRRESLHVVEIDDVGTSRAVHSHGVSTALASSSKRKPPATPPAHVRRLYWPHLRLEHSPRRQSPPPCPPPPHTHTPHQRGRRDAMRVTRATERDTRRPLSPFISLSPSPVSLSTTPVLLPVATASSLLFGVLSAAARIPQLLSMAAHRGRSAPARALLVLFLGFFVFLLLGAPSMGEDTVAAGRPLAGGESLVSKRGKFRLGFFQPDNSSDHWYLGIWYNQISLHTTVWVANRDTPITDPSSSQLSISTDGNMVIIDHRSSTVIWSTNVTAPTNSSTTAVVGVILDTGNLVLADASNTSAVRWQSFDHFGDTWLPGGKLGRNKLTGEVTRLIAWKSYKNPAPSMFSLELDPGGSSQYLLNWNGSVQYWSSGNWTGHAFAAVPEMTPTGTSPLSKYTFGYVDGEDEAYFVYDVTDESVVTRFLVDVTGQIKFLTWVDAAGEWVQFWSEPKMQCDVYDLCGPFGVCTENALPSCRCPRGFSERRPAEWMQSDRTAGCTRNTGMSCSDQKNSRSSSDRFYTMPDVKLPRNAWSAAAANAGDCELACLSNCSCTAYSYGDGGCSLWYGNLIDLQDTTSSGSAGGGSSISIRLAASEFSGTGNTKKKKLLIIGIVVAAFVAVVTAIVLVAMFILRSSRRINSLRRVEGSLMAFTYRDLQLVTKNFSEKLGGGAFGSVFKGCLPDATLVAVKKLEGVRQGEKQFRAEVSTIGTVQHVNLIRLLGFCSERTTRRLLVYEHMPMGSLDKHLFGNTTSRHGGVLSWSTRYQIALGIARGLDYLHEKCRDCIIHCDIKPENILLDEAFVPKVADFGLAKLMGRDFSRVLTTMRGTVGYLAPEWIGGAAVTTKADVFSYGMVLFEIVSGRRNVGQREDGGVDFFPATAASKLLAGDVGSAVDGKLAGSADVAEVERACKDDEGLRPSMGTVVQVLEGLVDVNVPPIPRSLKVLADPSKYVEFFSGLPLAAESLSSSILAESSDLALPWLSSDSKNSLPPPKSPQTPKKSSSEPTFTAQCGQERPQKAAAPWREALVPVAAAVASWPLPSLAAEGDGKVSLESIVVAVDDFNNRNPFFVAGVVFVWLVVIPLVQEYFLKKYKPVSAIDAFRKLRDVPEAQLLDIRQGKSVRFMAPPNLKLVDKSAVQVEFDEEDEKGFVKEVLTRFPDPTNTVVCVLDK